MGHSYSGIPVGLAVERIGDRPARVVFVDSTGPADGDAFASGWWQGREMPMFSPPRELVRILLDAAGR